MNGKYPRSPEMIRKTIDTIWADSQSVKCPVCATPMDEHAPYEWKCGVERCPIDGVDFNERVDSYLNRSKPKHDYERFLF